VPPLKPQLRIVTALAAGAMLAVGAQAVVRPAARPASAVSIFARAHRLHQRLLREPPDQRRGAQFSAIVRMLAPLRRQRRDAKTAAAAYYDSAGLEVERAQAATSYARSHAAWLRAVHFYYRLLLRYPYSAFRRNVDCATAPRPAPICGIFCGVIPPTPGRRRRSASCGENSPAGCLY
jgi:hypothetical protein